MKAKLDSPSFWSAFYKGGSFLNFDWFSDDKDVMNDIAKHVRDLKPKKVLHLGCGTSTLSEALHDGLLGVQRGEV